jgi:peptidoglycan/LPS O-acetylase OafA/YrhL
VDAPLTLARYLKARRYPALDGVRAIAVLMVITWHVPAGTFRPLHGSNGVTIFFVLSGFLITALGLRDERRGGFAYLPFVVKRGFRILPLLYLGLVVYAIGVFVLRADPRADEFADAIPWILVHLGEVPVLGVEATKPGEEGPVPFAAVWSLAIEEKFYLLWPPLAFGLLAYRRHRAPVAAGLCAGLWIFTVAGPPEIVRFVTHYAPLLLGCAMACALTTGFGHRLMAQLSHPAVALTALGAAAAITWAEPRGYSPIGFQVCCALILTNLILRPRSVVGLALATRPFVFIGALSYALYLFHTLALRAGEHLFPGSTAAQGLAQLAVGMAVAIPACWVLHVVVEKPAQRAGRSIAARLARRGTGRDGSSDDRLPATAAGDPFTTTAR